MQLRKDGHVRFYDETEWKYMCRKSGMEFEKIIYGGIRFSRKYEPEYEELMAQFPEKEIMPYHPVIKNGQISISVPVDHMMFTKQAQKKPEEKVSRPLYFQEERDKIKRAGKKGLRSYRSFITTNISKAFTAGYETEQADTSHEVSACFIMSYIICSS